MSDLGNPFDEMDVVGVLLNNGMEQGYITYDQILEALPNIENNLPLLETILEEAQSMGVPVFENEEEAGLAMSAEEETDLDDLEGADVDDVNSPRSEEHTSELQSHQGN